MAEKRLMLFGISGSGKTSVLKETALRYPHGTYIIVGDVVFDICVERKLGITSRDQILKDLSKKVLLDVQKEAYERIIKRLNESKSYLKMVDNHLVLRCRDGYFLGFPSLKHLEDMQIDVFYYIYCNPKIIKQRIELDKTRKRNLHEADISIMNNMSQAIYSSLVSYFPKSEFYIIDNTSTGVKNIVDVFIDKRLFGKNV